MKKMRHNEEETLGKHCIYDAQIWKIVGLTFNALGTFVTIRNAKDKSEKSVRFDEIQVKEEM